MCTRPVHATALQTRFDHQFVGAFDGAITDWPTGRLKGWVLHVCLTLLQIGQVRRQFTVLRLLAHQTPHRRQDRRRPPMLECMQLLRQPRLRLGAAFALVGLLHGMDVFASMWEVQDAHRPVTMVVDELLNPLRAIRHGGHRTRRLNPPPLRFH
jgi:hypothetical protein